MRSSVFCNLRVFFFLVKPKNIKFVLLPLTDRESKTSLIQLQSD